MDWQHHNRNGILAVATRLPYANDFSHEGLAPSWNSGFRLGGLTNTTHSCSSEMHNVVQFLP